MRHPLALLQRRFHLRDVYAAKPLFLATRRTVDSLAEPCGLGNLPGEIHVADTAPRPHCAAN